MQQLGKLQYQYCKTTKSTLKGYSNKNIWLNFTVKLTL